MTAHTHTLTEWASMVCMAASGFASFSVFYFLLVDADPADFDPRPVLRFVRQGVVYARCDVDRAVAAVRHELAPAAVCLRHAAHVAHEAARDAVALLILLTTRPKGAMAS